MGSYRDIVLATCLDFGVFKEWVCVSVLYEGVEWQL